MADAEPTDDTDQEQLELFEDPTGDGLADALVEPPPASDEAAPRIRLVRFSNFKSFDHFEVSLGNFNVVAGANNAGKSTLLQGIDLLYTLLKLHQERGQLAKARLVSPALLPVATGRDMFFRQVWRRSNVYVEASIGAEFADGSTIDFGLRYMFGNINSRVLENRGLEGTRLQALLARAAVWVPSAVGIVRDEEYRPPARQRGLVAAGRHNEVLRNTLVELRQNSEQRYGLLQSILRERFSAAVGEATFDPDLDQFVHGTYNADDGVEHDLYSAGSGFIQVLQMLAFVLARDAGVVLLDEPDAHLHSSLQRVVVEILDEISRDAGFQVLIATHSKEIINFVDPSRLILIEAGQGTAGLVSTDVTPVTVLKTLGAIDNVDAFALVRNRKCLFVEGTSDATILARMAATIGLSAFSGDDRVVTVPVGGADRFEHVAQLNVLESLLGGPLGSLEIRDRDGRQDAERQRLMDEAQRPLHVLDLDCIESYLVGPDVLTRVVGEIIDERVLDVDPPGQGEMAELIMGIAESMRQDAEDRISERYTRDRWSMDREQVRVPDANARARRHVDANWGTLSERLRVLPGKKLLGRVRAEIQDRYSVNFGNERLAEAFSDEEIPLELREQLQRGAAL